MTHDPDIEGLAAEYVLGSLTNAEREEVDSRRKSDIALDAAVLAWQRRLAPLSELTPEVEPRADAFASILARISQVPRSEPRSADIHILYRNARRWRRVATGASLLAACLALVAGWFFYLQNAAPTALVAELYRASANTTADEIMRPSFVVTVDLKGCTVSVRPVTARLRAGQTYQLWAVRHGTSAPSPLGLIARAETTTLACPAGFPAAEFANAMMAVSLEPEGGSTTGAPSSAFMFVGKLVAAPTSGFGGPQQ